MYLFMLDVDNTLIQSDSVDYFNSAVQNVTGISIKKEDTDFLQTTDIRYIESIINEYDLQHDRLRIIKEVRLQCLLNLREELSKNPSFFKPTPGAIEFIQFIKRNSKIIPAVISGGWEEITKLKLKSIGIDVTGLCFSSCSDASTRSEIMALAAFRAKQDAGAVFHRRFFFGCSTSDQLATKTLGYEFINVGNLSHQTNIQDFTYPEAIFSKLNLNEIITDKL